MIEQCQLVPWRAQYSRQSLVDGMTVVVDISCLAKDAS
jgi:hypothetical protein